MRCETRIMCRAHVLEKGPKKRVLFFKERGSFHLMKRVFFFKRGPFSRTRAHSETQKGKESLLYQGKEALFRKSVVLGERGSLTQGPFSSTQDHFSLGLFLVQWPNTRFLSHTMSLSLCRSLVFSFFFSLLSFNIGPFFFGPFFQKRGLFSLQRHSQDLPSDIRFRSRLK